MCVRVRLSDVCAVCVVEVFSVFIYTWSTGRLRMPTEGSKLAGVNTESTKRKRHRRLLAFGYRLSIEHVSTCLWPCTTHPCPEQQRCQFAGNSLSCGILWDWNLTC